MLEAILPACVEVAATTTDVADPVLFPEEEAIVERAVGKRRREFATGRACARDALARLGMEPGPILVGARGAPLWPAGVVGSITHCAGYRASAVARSSDLLTLGVDAEPNEPLPDGLIADIAVAEELGWLRRAAAEAPEVRWERLLFSVKESVYKAWFPLAGRWLGFEDAAVAIDRDAGTFVARLLVPGPSLPGGVLTEFRGRWLIRDGIVLAAIAVAAGTGEF